MENSLEGFEDKFTEIESRTKKAAEVCVGGRGEGENDKR